MVKIIADSLNIETGQQITTFVIERMPKCLLAELNTHRMLSRNAASSRAIPIEKVIQRIEEDPYIPQFTRNQKGMQGEIGDKQFQEEAELKWLRAMDYAIAEAQRLSEMGVHKQNANRLLEPFMYVPVVVTGTEWENFFKLRCAKPTHPDLRNIAREMADLYIWANPKDLRPGEWHIPFVDDLHNPTPGGSLIPFADALKISSARCARISYTTHDGRYSFERDFGLHDLLVKEGHFSPLEHSAVAIASKTDKPEYGYLKDGKEVYTRNFRGFYSYRAHIEDGYDVT
jgi:thymidylate synthase ThyX